MTILTPASMVAVVVLLAVAGAARRTCWMECRRENLENASADVSADRARSNREVP